MDSRFESITTNVFLFRDTCNVYIVRSGSSCVLVDFGDGRVMANLADIGVDRVCALLHTHHHRDQAQGDNKAVEAGIPIYVPRHERHLFDQAELYWSTKQLYDIVNVRNSYFTLTKSIAISGLLIDFEHFDWEGLSFAIVPTPGHTPGSISLLLSIDGMSIAFTGDLIHSAGKVHTLHDMQHAYASLDGIEATTLSLDLLKEKVNDFVCPSHGEIMSDAVDALSSTEANLRSYFHLLGGDAPMADEHDFTRINSRLLFASYANSSFYVLLSPDGKRALFIDYGAMNDAQFSPSTLRSESGDTVRFFPHSIRRLQMQYGIEFIDVVIPTHCHDDHICGIPYLIGQFGTKVWALDAMTELLENPAREITGCVFPDPIPVARALTDGERVTWEDLSFDVCHTPGHSEYHMSMFTEIEGKTIAFSGDNVWPPGFIPNVVYRNHLDRESHQKTAKLFRDRRPDVLCTGHGIYEDIPPESYEKFPENAKRLSVLFDTLLPAGSGLTGIDPTWIRIVPYQFQVRYGAASSVNVEIKNPFERETAIEISWVLPAGWTATRATHVFALGVNGIVRKDFRILLPEATEVCKNQFPKRAITLDVVIDGVQVGQIAEAVAEFAPYGPAGAGQWDPL